jgi:hypothetical protein
MIEVRLHRIGIVAQGLVNWQETSALLAGERQYTEGELLPLKPSMLKPNERRRTTKTIKIALQAAEEALRDWPDTEEVLSVFSSSEGDLDIIDQICLALSLDDHPVSPTQFHNSVHNAPAGYWSIGSGSRQASSSLAGQDGSFAAGLLEAAVQSVMEKRPVLMVSYDQPPPPLLKPFMPITAPFSVALLLSSETTGGIARMILNTLAGDEESRMTEPALEQLRSAAPAARCLPMLKMVAKRQPAQLTFPYLPGLRLQMDIAPC